MSKSAALRLTDKARWERLVMRHPGLALPRLRQAMAGSDGAQARAALQGLFFVQERLGRAAELQGELQQALQQAERQRALAEAAELSEALGRLHYQRGDYAQACNAWSQTLDWAADDSRSACLARIGLAHLCYALGEWARGGRVLDQAELHYPRLGSDPYLQAKILLNRAASLRVTQGPQAALGALDEALAAARQAGHRDYQAEAIWQQARCARDSGDLALASALAQRALSKAQGCGYRWLQAHAALLLSELNAGDIALGWAGQALSLGEALQSRAVQASAHGRLAELMQAQGELGPAWHHQQQRQQLEATLNQGQLPTQLEALARFDTDPGGADALLLALAGQAWRIGEPEDLVAAWATMQPQLLKALDLLDLQLWWDRGGEGQYQALPPSETAAVTAPLTAQALKPYLAALARPEEPLICLDAAQHPWAAALALGPGLHQSRLELGLRLDGRLVGWLWALRAEGASWSRADVSRALRLAGLLERLLEQLLQAREREAAGQQARAQHQRLADRLQQARQPLELALGQSATLAGRLGRLQQLGAGQGGAGVDGPELARLGAELSAGVAQIERELRRSLLLLAELRP